MCNILLKEKYMTTSLQEALVKSGLATTEELEQKRKERRVDDMLDVFERVEVSNATFIITLKHVEWATRPENKAKSMSDFRAYARAELLKHI